MKARIGIAIGLLLALVACGGGGGGGAIKPPIPVPTQTPTTLQGDMLALSPSKGWNYQGILKGSAVTVSMYADPNLVNNVRAWIGSAVLGSVPTVLTSPSNVTSNLIGALGLSVDTSNNYTAVTELSSGGLSPIPGGVLLVPASLTTGQTWQSNGGTATVVAAGVSVAGSAACGPSAALGAKVRYVYAPAGVDDTFSYVPSCGLTDVLNNGNGEELTLISTANYPTIGQLARVRNIYTATALDTLKTLLGMERSKMAGSKVVHGIFTSR